MCGIVGILSTEKFDVHSDREQFMRQALVCGVLRGENSTGVLYVNHDNRMGAWKHTFAGPDFVQHKVVDKILNNTRDFKAFIGHHRFRTSGQITRKDAHPHEHKHITLVHNGGISNSHTLKGHVHEAGDPDVDTFRLTKAMAEEGALETLKAVDGSYALVWWDSKENALFMAKNKERPLSILWSKDRKNLYLASEWEMLTWLTRRNRIETEQKCIQLKENNLYRFDIDSDAKSITMSKTSYPEKKEVIVRGFSPYTGEDSYFGEQDWERWPHQRSHEMARGSHVDHQRVVPFIDRGRPVNSHLPAIRKEAERVAEEAKKKEVEKLPDLKTLGGVDGIEKSMDRLTAKKLRKINDALKEKKLAYGSQIWARPEVFYRYKNTHMGVGEYTFLPDNSPIQVHNLSELGWNKSKESTLLVPIAIVDMAHNKKAMYGHILWHKLAESWDYVVGAIDQASPLAFIPGEDGRYLTKKQFYALTDTGCSMCKELISLREAPDLFWLDQKPVCADCSAPIDIATQGPDIPKVEDAVIVNA